MLGNFGFSARSRLKTLAEKQAPSSLGCDVRNISKNHASKFEWNNQQQFVCGGYLRFNNIDWFAACGMWSHHHTEYWKSNSIGPIRLSQQRWSSTRASRQSALWCLSDELSVGANCDLLFHSTTTGRSHSCSSSTWATFKCFWWYGTRSSMCVVRWLLPKWERSLKIRVPLIENDVIQPMGSFRIRLN